MRLVRSFLVSLTLLSITAPTLYAQSGSGEGHVVATNGADIYYEEHGEGSLCSCSMPSAGPGPAGTATSRISPSTIG